MGAVVVGIHVANAQLTGDNVVGLLRCGGIRGNALLPIPDLIGAVAKKCASGLLLVVGVGSLAVDEIGAVFQGDHGLVGLAALEDQVGIDLPALRCGEFLCRVALAAHHKAAVLHQGDLPGGVLHIVDLIPGLVAAGFLRGQVLGVVVGIAAAVLALGQHTDTGGNGEDIALPGVSAAHAEIRPGEAGIPLDHPLIVVQLILAVRGQHQQIDGLHGAVPLRLPGGGQVGLLVEILGHGAFRGLVVGIRLQLGQDIPGSVGIINGIDGAADRGNHQNRRAHQHRCDPNQDLFQFCLHWAPPLRFLRNFRTSRTLRARNTTAAREEKIMPSIRENCHQFMVLTMTPFSFMALEFATV